MAAKRSNGKRQPRREPEAEDDDFVTPEEFEDIDSFFAMTAGVSSVVIARIETNGDLSVCETVAFDTIRDDPAEYIRSKWGSGKFTLRLRNEMKQYRGHKTIRIADPKYGPQFLGNGGYGGAAGHDPMVNVYREMNAAMLTLLQSSLAAKSGGGGDVVALIAGLGSLLKPPDPAAMLANMATTFKTLKPEETKPTDPFAGVDTMLKIAERINGGKGGDESWASVVREVGGKLAESLPQVFPANRGAARPLPTSTDAKLTGAAPIIEAGGSTRGADPTAENGEGPVSESERQEMFYDALREGITFLNSKANTKNIDFWVEYLFDGSDLPNLNAVIHAVKLGGTVDQLIAFAPELRPNETWFKHLHAAIQLRLDNESKGQQEQAP